MKWIPIALLVGLVLSAGCKKVDEFQDADIVSGDAEFAIPLIKATASVQDLLENFDEYTFIEITPDGVIHLRYKGDVLTEYAHEYLEEAKDSLPPFIPLEDTLYALPFSSPAQLEIDFATYKSGKVSFAAKSDQYVGKLFFSMSILGATKNGVVATVRDTFQSPTGGITGLYWSDKSLDMSGFNLEPENGILYIRYEAITETGDRLKLPNVVLINQDVNFSYLSGYLGNFKHNGKRDSVAIEFFENWRQGDVFFEQPTININLENSFGVPTRSVIKVFEIVTADGIIIPLESDFITQTGIDFVYPELNEVGQVKSMTFTFNESNSNIEDVLGSRPILLDYDVDARMNPDTLTGLRGFITDSSYYNIQLDVDLPLHGRASGFGVADTFNVDFDGYGDVKEAEFKLVADNDMPIGIDAQVYFLDENGSVLDSLFNENRQRIVASAEVGSDGIVTGRSTQTTFAAFPAERFDKVRQAKRLALHAWFSTFNEGQQSVKAFANQKVDVRMGMKLKTD